MRWPLPRTRFHRRHIVPGRQCWCEPEILEDPAYGEGRAMVVHNDPRWRGEWAMMHEDVEMFRDAIVVPDCAVEWHESH